TFRDVARRADRIALALRRLGVGAGDVVSWQLPNWMECAALAAAIDRLGAISNPIITIYREREVGFVCRQAGSRVLVVPGPVRGGGGAPRRAGRGGAQGGTGAGARRRRGRRAGPGAARAGAARGRPRLPPSRLSARPARRRIALLHLGDDGGSEGRVAHAV